VAVQDPTNPRWAYFGPASAASQTLEQLAERFYAFTSRPPRYGSVALPGGGVLGGPPTVPVLVADINKDRLALVLFCFVPVGGAGPGQVYIGFGADMKNSTNAGAFNRGMPMPQNTGLVIPSLYTGQVYGMAPDGNIIGDLQFIEFSR
jgi:hypothetical protein